MKICFKTFSKQNNFKNLNFNHKSYSTKKHNTNFDYHIDWLYNKLFTNNLTIVKSLIGINAAIFLYSWLRPTEEGRYIAQSGVSFSPFDLRKREYTNLFLSLLGSRKVEDFAFDTAVLVTLGRQLEKIHGTPFMLKMFVFYFYIGILSSSFWAASTHSQRERYILKSPSGKNVLGLQNEMKFSSMHGFTMSIVYFYLFKRMKLLILPVLVADYIIWGPYYMSGILNGLAWGMIV
ncbi:MAG: hypothetical protein ACK5YA_00360 [bacterium]